MITKVFTTAMCILGLLLALSGCGSTCSSACNKIYEECKLAFPEMSESQCVDECEASEDQEKNDTIDCVMKASCAEESINACL